MAAQAPAFNNIMDHGPSFGNILINFGLSQKAKSRLTEDFPTATDLMASNLE